MSHEVRKGYDEPFVMIHDSQLDALLGKVKPYTLAVFVALMRRANRKAGMTCYPSLATIAEDAGVSRSSVKVALKELVDAGVLLIDKRLSDEGDHATNLYTLLRPSGRSSGDRGGPQDDPRVGREATHGVGREATTNHMKSYEPDEGEPDISPLADARARERTFWFDQFWELYPRKTKKKEARRAWDKLPHNPDLYEEIIHAVSLHTQTTWRDTETRYVPHASSWLNGERWKDEPVASGSGRRRRGLTGDEIEAAGLDLEARMKEMFG